MCNSTVNMMQLTESRIGHLAEANEKKTSALLCVTLPIRGALSTVLGWLKHRPDKSRTKIEVSLVPNG